MSDAKVNDEPVLDSGSRYCCQPSETDIESHRSQRAVYVGLHLPSDVRGISGGHSGHRRRRHRRHPRPEKGSGKEPLTGIVEDESERGGPATDASQHVMFLLGEEADEDESHQLFCEMDELVTGDDSHEWKETARWIKFEEDVEDGGERWSKPYVATLPLYSLFEVRNCLSSGVILLNVEAFTIEQIVDLMLNKVISEGKLDPELRDKVADILLKKHSHLHERKHKSGLASRGSHLPLIRSLAEIGRKHSSKDVEKAETDQKEQGAGSCAALAATQSQPGLVDHENDLHSSPSSQKFDLHFMKKIPPGAETSNILVGETDFLPSLVVTLIRLKEAVLLGDLTEVPVPTRFLFILLGPQGNAGKYHEMGRSMATLMSDEVFHDVAYKARNREDLIAGIDEFLSNCTVLPPGEWDPTIRIEPPKSVPSQDARKAAPALPNGQSAPSLGAVCSTSGGPPPPHSGGEEHEEHCDPTLVRTGRLFGGLMEDIKRRKVHYLSDFKDACHVQCFASFFFLYFACLTPIITFGGLLHKETGGYLGTMESILAGAIVGVSYALFSGQPLTILGSTGPVLVFEKIVFDMCTTFNYEYLSFRLWIGIWVSLSLLIIVAFDLSALVRYITRFTEESFAFLIALIFIKEAIKKQWNITEDYPFNPKWAPDLPDPGNCSCTPPNSTDLQLNYLKNATRKAEAYPPPIIRNASDYPIAIDYQNLTDRYFTWNHKKAQDLCTRWGGKWEGPGCGSLYIPDVFFFSCLIFLGTFAISYSLKQLRNSSFFPNFVRCIISDFAVMIAIVSMTLVDYFVGFHSPKLSVPGKFEPTLGYKVRGWLVPPFNGNPYSTVIFALGPALLAVILIFMDQQITAVIVNRKENKLKKGSGYHLDLLMVAILILINSILGIPWFVAATVLSINHVMSLKKESENNAPGERPKFLGCREQRVTGVMIFLTIGLSVFLTPVLQFIPMAVLYGVFLFMGIASLRGVQLVQRIMIFVMPPKYQPDYTFLRHVPLNRVHLFTCIQVLCLALLWVIKTVKSVSILFPIMVLAMCFIRFALEKLFTQNELKWLDDLLPDFRKSDENSTKDERDNKAGGDIEKGEPGDGNPPAHVDSHHDMNISEEMTKTSIWKQLTQGNSASGGDSDKKKKKKKQRGGDNSSDEVRRCKSRGSSDKRDKKRDTSSSGGGAAAQESEVLLEMPEIVINPPSNTGSPEMVRRSSSDANA